jgi:hypothetical protein
MGRAGFSQIKNIALHRRITPNEDGIKSWDFFRFCELLDGEKPIIFSRNYSGLNMAVKVFKPPHMAVDTTMNYSKTQNLANFWKFSSEDIPIYRQTVPFHDKTPTSMAE